MKSQASEQQMVAVIREAVRTSAADAARRHTDGGLGFTTGRNTSVRGCRPTSNGWQVKRDLDISVLKQNHAKRWRVSGLLVSSLVTLRYELRLPVKE